MWNGGLFLLWNNIADLFYEERSIVRHILSKLTYDHIKLTYDHIKLTYDHIKLSSY